MCTSSHNDAFDCHVLSLPCVQITPPPQLAGHALRDSWPKDVERAQLAEMCVWQPSRCADTDLADLLAFSQRLACHSYTSEHRYNEQTMTHLHGCLYSLVLAKYTLLFAHERLAEVSLDDSEVLGHKRGDVLMALLRSAHTPQLAQFMTAAHREGVAPMPAGARGFAGVCNARACRGRQTRAGAR